MRRRAGRRRCGRVRHRRRLASRPPAPPPRPPPSGTASPPARAAATGTSTPATATTAACSSPTDLDGLRRPRVRRARGPAPARAQQIAVAQKVLASQGPGAWPRLCSVRAGLTRGQRRLRRAPGRRSAARARPQAPLAPRRLPRRQARRRRRHAARTPPAPSSAGSAAQRGRLASRPDVQLRLQRKVGCTLRRRRRPQHGPRPADPIGASHERCLAPRPRTPCARCSRTSTATDATAVPSALESVHPLDRARASE